MNKFLLLYFIPFLVQPLLPGNLSRSKLGIHLIGKYTEGAKKIIFAGPRVVKVLDPHISSDLKKAIKEYKSLYPDGVVVLRIWDKTSSIRYSLNDDPIKSAEDFWKKVLEPAINCFTREELKLIDYLEGPNEGENTPTWENVESAKWFGVFWEKLAELISSSGIKPCAGSIGVGSPSGSIEEIEAKLEAFIPALISIKKYNGAWSYHSYTLKYSTDPVIEKFYSLRYRIFYNFLTKQYPELADLPMILTEGGVDKLGNPLTDGWKARGNAQKYIEYLEWFDSEIQKDRYIVGVTLFQIGDSQGWPSFDIEEISGWFSEYLRRYK